MNLKTWIDSLAVKQTAGIDQLLTTCAKLVNVDGAYKEVERAQAAMVAANNSLGLYLVTLGHAISTKQALENMADSLDSS
jgi:hypothetical protein